VSAQQTGHIGGGTEEVGALKEGECLRRLPALHVVVAQSEESLIVVGLQLEHTAVCGHGAAEFPLVHIAPGAQHQEVDIVGGAVEHGLAQA